jgi:flagellar protein FliJ
MKPRFSLQRILELRERKEQAVAVRLSSARSVAERARELEEQIESLKREGIERRMGTPGSASTVGELQNTSYIIEQLEQQLTDARTAVKQADGQVNAVLAEFSVATRERQVLDRLKEKKREAAMLEAADADRKTMDAVALTRFGRRSQTNNGSDE